MTCPHQNVTLVGAGHFDFTISCPSININAGVFGHLPLGRSAVAFLTNNFV